MGYFPFDFRYSLCEGGGDCLARGVLAIVFVEKFVPIVSAPFGAEYD
jgi:hypothetical protein